MSEQGGHQDRRTNTRSGERQGHRHLVWRVAALLAGLTLVWVATFAFAADDTTPPAVTCDAATSYSNSAFIMISAVDTESVVASISYKLDADTTQTITGDSVGVSTSLLGEHTLAYFATNAAGLSSATATATFTVVDTAGPVVTLLPESAATIGDYRSDPVTVSVTASDGSGAGVATTYYSVDSGTERSFAGGSGSITVSGSGEHTVTAHAVDALGNSGAEESISFTIDSAGPAVTPALHSAKVSGIYRSDPVTVTASADDGTGVGGSTIYWKSDGGSFAELPPGSFATVTGSGEHTVTVYAADALGNSGDAVVTTFTIDATAPAVSFGAITPASPVGASGWRQGPVGVSITTDDGAGGSGVGKTYYKIDGSQYAEVVDGLVTVSESGEHTITCYAEDKLGAVSPEVEIAVKCDATGPVITEALAPAAVTDGWRTAPATVTIDALDAHSGLAGRSYRVGADPVQVYSAPFAVSEGEVAVTITATDTVGNVSTKVVTVRSDSTSPSVPASFNFSAITTGTVTFRWDAATDSPSGVAYYQLVQDPTPQNKDNPDGVLISRIYGTTVKTPERTADLEFLRPGQTYRFYVRSVDKAGNKSGRSAPLLITMPTVGAAESVGAGTSVDTTVTLPGTTLGPATFSFSDVITAGVLKWTLTSQRPAPAPGAWRFLGTGHDVSFSGVYSGETTVTLPYDPGIPAVRAAGLKVLHWTGSSWDTIAPTSVDTTARRLTFTAATLSPFSIAESSTVDMRSTLVAGFAKYNNAASTLTTNYRQWVTLVGQLSGAYPGSGGLGGRTVVVERYTGSATPWAYVGTATASTASGQYTYSFYAPYAKTAYRMRFVGDSINTGVFSGNRTVYPRVKLAVKAPTTAYRYRTFYVSGTIYPTHPKGSTGVVRVYAQKYTYSYTTRKWYWASARIGSASYVRATMTSTGAWRASVKMTSAGLFRFKAYAVADTLHAATAVYTPSCRVR